MFVGLAGYHEINTIIFEEFIPVPRATFWSSVMILIPSRCSGLGGFRDPICSRDSPNTGLRRSGFGGR